jgi:hypothetical protein
MPDFSFKIYISNDYVKLIKKETYELIILRIINESKKIFPGTFEYVENQSNGESDFINVETGESFDSKVLFSSSICKLISKKSSSWMSIIFDISNETYNAIMNAKTEQEILNNISMTKMYLEYLKRIDSIKKYEKCILFLPFPLTLDLSKSLFSIISSSSDNLIVKSLIKYNKTELLDKEIYIIYPNIENKIVIRKLFDGKKAVHEIEFLSMRIISEYITTTNIGF